MRFMAGVTMGRTVGREWTWVGVVVEGGGSVEEGDRRDRSDRVR